LKSAQRPGEKEKEAPSKEIAVAKPKAAAAKRSARGSTESADSIAVGEVLPKPVYSPPPKYPVDAKGVSGWVVLQFTVNVDGSTTSVEVVGSNPKGVFDEVAMHAIHSWVFSPDTVNGARQRKLIRYRLDFKP
ncbi:MAG TPA: energy transducer TonB, partial [Gammaproteobacteria bacterium]|nr:energy transducer TonB [Gammaproteobacteria bacterium]